MLVPIKKNDSSYRDLSKKANVRQLGSCKKRMELGRLKRKLDLVQLCLVITPQQTVNLYNYAYNSPIKFTDPDGRKPSEEQKQFTCLLCTVFAEARGQSCECQHAVASVIINRLARKRDQHPGQQITICDIVSEAGQFNGYGNSNYRRCRDCTHPNQDRELEENNGCFLNSFDIGPPATYFGSGGVAGYFRRLGLHQVSFPACPVFVFFGS